jgi:hypothetical protein
MLGGLRLGRSRALLLGGVALTMAAAAAPISGSASTHASSALPHLRVLPTLAHRADCLPPIISLTCTGNGMRMTTGGGPIETSPAVYIVFWGWNGVDPAGMAARQQNFFNGVGGSTWNASQTQYCQNPADPAGATCGSTFVGNPTGVLKGTWSDNTQRGAHQP